MLSKDFTAFFKLRDCFFHPIKLNVSPQSGSNSYLIGILGTP